MGAKLSRKDIADRVSEDLGTSKTTTRQIVSAVFEEIKKSVKADDSIIIRDFGTFSMKARAARKGRNPSTGEPLDIPASVTCKFKVGTGFKNMLN